MPRHMLDDVDRGILYFLQRDARHTSAKDIADEVSVSANTVRNRIARLEDRGVIEGYQPTLNYEEADFQLRVLIICSASIIERSELAQQALNVSGVINVRELMMAQRNIRVTAVGGQKERIMEIVHQLAELGLTIESEELVTNEYSAVFEYFSRTVSSQ